MGNTRSLRSSTRVVCVNGKHPSILDPTLGISDSRYWILDSLLVERGFRIPIVRGIPLSLSWISDSKALDPGFHKQEFPGFRIRTTRQFRTSWFGKKTLNGGSFVAKTKAGSSERRALLESFVLRYAKSHNRVCLFSDEYCIKHEVFNSKIAANLETVNL